MRLLLAVLITATFALADDWTGKTIKPKEAVKLGRKVGNGIARDGAEVDTKKTYVVKSDDGTLLELADGYIFKFEAELGKEPDLPKAKAKDTDAAKDKGDWFGKKVLPKRSPDTIQMGDYDKDEKPYYWTPHNLGNCIVREDKGGFLRLYDGRREGWVKKEDMVTAEDAPAWWDQEVKKNPNSDYGWHMRGVSWFDKKEYDNAIKDLTEAIRLKPDSSASYNWRGNAWAGKQEHDKAIADFTEAIRLDPKDAYPYSNRGIAWSKKKEYDKAIADYTEAIRLDPKYATAYINRGIAWEAKKEYGKAIADYTEAIRLNPKNAAAYSNRGIAWEAKKEYDKAIADYTEAIRLDPKDTIAYNNRGNVWSSKLEYDKAIADYSEAIRLNPKDTIAYNNRGLVWSDKKEYDKAIADYTEAIRLDLKLETAYRSRGIAWDAKKEYGKAIADYTEAIRLDPKNASAFYSRGVVWGKKKEYDKAIADYTEAIRLDSKYAGSFNNLAWLHARCPDAKFRDGKKAVEYGNKLVELNPWWGYRDTLAAAYAEAGDFDMAVKTQQKAIEMLKAEKNPDAKDLKELEARLQLYRDKKPYREE